MTTALLEKVKALRAVTLSVTLLIACLALVSPATAASSYGSCPALLKDYPNGVASSAGAASRVVKAGFVKASVNSAVYQANRSRLDPDGNGVVCESKRTASSLSPLQLVFVELVRKEGSAFAPYTDVELLRLGRTICKILDDGGEMDAVMNALLDSRLTDKAPALLGYSIGVLCPGHEQFLKDYVASFG